LEVVASSKAGLMRRLLLLPFLLLVEVDEVGAGRFFRTFTSAERADSNEEVDDAGEELLGAGGKEAEEEEGDDEEEEEEGEGNVSSCFTRVVVSFWLSVGSFLASLKLFFNRPPYDS